MPDKPANVKPASSAVSGPCKTDVYEAHVQGGCAGCHALMDGIGFGLENYDGTGRYRLTEPDNPATDGVDESECALASEGELLLAGESLPFSGPGELGALLADRDEFTACMVKQFYRFASGRSELDDFDIEFVRAMTARLGANGLRFEDVVLDLVSDESFLYHRDPIDEEDAP